MTVESLIPMDARANVDRRNARTVPLGQDLCALPRTDPSCNLPNPPAYRLADLRLEGARRTMHDN